jgi:pimeloyl-ACP methyl ester carboxylesterase
MQKQFAFEKNEQLSYTEYGNITGFPILIQHGMIASINEGNLFQNLIEKGFRLICIARPGYGFSSPYILENIAEYGKLISDLVKYLGIQSFDVFGISSGAPYGYSIGNSNPEKTRNIYILSGTPALYNKEVQEEWPYTINTKGSISDFQTIAKSVFFDNMNEVTKKQNDVIDSMKNDCFGVALDLMIRFKNWGFDLSGLQSKVYMQHSEDDNSVPYKTALLTSKLLPNCEFSTRKGNIHFSPELLTDFIENTINL